MSATDVIPEVLLSPGTWNSGDWLWLLNFRKLLLLEMFSYHNKPISMQLLSHSQFISMRAWSFLRCRCVGLAIKTSPTAPGTAMLVLVIQTFDSAAGCRRPDADWRRLLLHRRVLNELVSRSPNRSWPQRASTHAARFRPKSIQPTNDFFLFWQYAERFLGNRLNVLHLQQFLKYHYHLVN